MKMFLGHFGFAHKPKLNKLLIELLKVLLQGCEIVEDLGRFFFS